MPSAIRVITRLQDQDDVATPGASDTGKAFVWNNATSSFDLSTSSVETHLADSTIHRVINDSSTASTVLWSGSKINTEIGTVSSSLSSHTGDATIHRVINDSSTASTVLWSGSKINTELGTKFNTDGSTAMSGDLNLGGNEITSSGAISINCPTGQSLQFDINGTQQIIMNSSGNLGIGNSSPQSKLHVGNSTGAPSQTAQIYAAQTGAANLTVKNTTSTAEFFIQASDHAYTGTYTAHNYYLRSSNVTRMTLHSAGNIGIGNSSPQGSLHVGNSTGAPSQTSQLYVGQAGTAAFTVKNTTSTAEFFIQSAASVVAGTYTAHNLSLSTNNTTRMTFLSTGNIGIGETAPAAKLHIKSGDNSGSSGGDTYLIVENNTNAFIQVRSGSTGDGGLIFGDAGAVDGGAFVYQHSTNQYYWRVDSTIKLYLDASELFPATDNDIGLGKSGARYTDVWAVNGTIQTSDADKKVYVKDSDLGLDFVKKLKPKSWRWPGTREQKRRKHYGLVAQDVKNTLDELQIDTLDFAAYIEGENGELSLRYSEFIGPIIKSIQDLSSRVDGIIDNGV